MKSKGLLAFTCAVTLLSLGLPGLAQAPFRDTSQQHDHQEIDPKILIKATAAHELLTHKKAVFVDVRSRPEYNAEHIQGALSYPYQLIKMTEKYPFEKKQKLILYCGCPHHLSGLSADILKMRGYQDVHVIDEGYFGWKAQGFPVMVNPQAPEKISMNVEGKVMLGKLPAVYRDIFLLHPESGQLEATRTDAQGNFRMALHFGGVTPDDKVVFQMFERDLKTLRLSDLKQAVQLDLPEQLALQ